MNTNTTNKHIRRALRRAGTTTVVTAALLAGTVIAGASAASAADTLPPEAAYLVTAPGGLPSTAGSPNYWATDDCHYYALDGNWYADVCMRRHIDTNGNLIPGVVGLFANAGNGQIGPEQLRIDVSTPGHMSVGIPDRSGAVPGWTTFVQGKNNQGQPIWVQQMPNTTTGAVVGGTRSGVPDVSGLSRAQGDVILGLFMGQQNANFCASIIWVGDSYCTY